MTVIDFPKVAGSTGAHSVLAKWVFDYFKTPLVVTDQGKDAFGKLMSTKGSSVRVCEDRMPLYLQHQGHSRVIVGVEQTKGGELNLLLFDCGKYVDAATTTPYTPADRRLFSGKLMKSSRRPPVVGNLKTRIKSLNRF